MMKSRFFALAAVLGGFCLTGTVYGQEPAAPAPAPAPAPAAVKPGLTTATYQDWMARCVASNNGRICEVVQNLQAQGQGLIASIAVGKADPKSPLRLVIQVPAGVWLPAGVTFQVSEKVKPLQLEYKRCVQGCFAEVELEAAAAQAMRAAKDAGSFTFEDGSRNPVTLPVSFNGFSAALDASLRP